MADIYLDNNATTMVDPAVVEESLVAAEAWRRFQVVVVVVVAEADLEHSESSFVGPAATAAGCYASPASFSHYGHAHLLFH